jgi:hypothetical protein
MAGFSMNIVIKDATKIINAIVIKIANAGLVTE